ncbi:hypothetical protein TNIN_357371 [Trichonephila inaurata madagascariensis]|uniref:Uncharacterized protein n=1 Tax=Trichonephila inaurata madagascariensis TaxID=2747483 RepID=A0A8X7CNZ4_9ARAC|nr:hypothetical protein TNIN_357371 [Trichonephila inaurata madagascariensis]
MHIPTLESFGRWGEKFHILLGARTSSSGIAAVSAFRTSSVVQLQVGETKEEGSSLSGRFFFLVFQPILNWNHLGVYTGDVQADKMEKKRTSVLSSGSH